MPKGGTYFKGARTGKDRYTSHAVRNKPGYDYTVDYKDPYKDAGMKKKNSLPKPSPKSTKYY
jgi:hypothetical protein